MAVITYLTDRSCLDEAVTALQSQELVGAINVLPPAAANVQNETFQTMVIRRLETLETSRDAVDSEILDIKAKLSSIQEQLDELQALSKRIAGILERMGARLDCLETKHDSMEAKLNGIETKLDALTAFGGEGVVISTPTLLAAVLVGAVAVRSVFMESVQYVVGWWKRATRLAGGLAGWLSHSVAV